MQRRTRAAEERPLTSSTPPRPAPGLGRWLGLMQKGQSSSRPPSRPLSWLIGLVVGAFVFFRALDAMSPNAGTSDLPGFRSRSSASRRTDVRQQQSLRKQRLAQTSVGRGAPDFTELAPFTFCPSFGDLDELGNIYGPAAIHRTRSHIGSGERVRRVIRRAMSGLPITVGVLGGSVSSCHGLDSTSAHPLGNPIGPNCYPHRIFSWLNDVFPHPANELTNGALRRTGTSYFGFCSAMHLPDRVDLVILEFDTEDPHDPATLQTTDLLVRSLLLRPDQPAVILLGHFAPQVQNEHGFAGPDVWHSSVASFYDVPHLTAKGLLYEDYVTNPDKVKQSYFLDMVLANAKGHELLADTVISYLESEICATWDAAAVEADLANMGRPVLGDTDFAALARDQDGLFGEGSGLLGGQGIRKGSDAGFDGRDVSGTAGSGQTTRSTGRTIKVPPFRVTDKPDAVKGFREVKPHCASANDLINPLPKSVFANSGWQPVVPKPEEEEERHFWFSDKPGSLLKVPIKVGAGDIAVYYQKGPADQGWGRVLCWVDDNTRGAVELNGSWDRGYIQPTVTQIDQHVGAGSHYVVCELQGDPVTDKVKFKIYGIFST